MWVMWALKARKSIQFFFAVIAGFFSSEGEYARGIGWAIA